MLRFWWLLFLIELFHAVFTALDVSYDERLLLEFFSRHVAYVPSSSVILNLARLNETDRAQYVVDVASVDMPGWVSACNEEISDKPHLVFVLEVEVFAQETFLGKDDDQYLWDGLALRAIELFVYGNLWILIHSRFAWFLKHSG